MKTSEIPKFGPLQGVTAICVGVATAGPYAVTLMAEFGATVINIENVRYPDMNRPTGIFEQDHRNQLGMALNVPSPEGREILFKLLKNADILIENSKGGTWKKWGLTDEVLWEVNPALVIAHISGFGLTGLPEYIERPSFDGTGNAFGTITALNGTPDKPMNILPSICDKTAALYASWAALAALFRAKQTGKGESIDVAQFETMLGGQSGSVNRALNTGVQPPRNSGDHELIAGFTTYKCLDGFIFIGFMGMPAMTKGMALLGLEWGTELFPKTQDTFVLRKVSPEGAELLEQRLIEYCASRTVDEVDAELTATGVPCSPCMTFEMAYNNPQYQAREVFQEWETMDGAPYKGVGIIPKLSQAPGQIWRSAPTYGLDNDDILAELGYSDDQIASFYTDGVLNKRDA